MYNPEPEENITKPPNTTPWCFMESKCLIPRDPYRRSLLGVSADTRTRYRKGRVHMPGAACTCCTKDTCTALQHGQSGLNGRTTDP